LLSLQSNEMSSRPSPWMLTPASFEADRRIRV
jgi:hypothetical protein